MNDFPLISKWVSRKLAVVALFLVFLSNTGAEPRIKAIAATVVCGLYVVIQGVLDRTPDGPVDPDVVVVTPPPPAPPVAPTVVVPPVSPPVSSVPGPELTV